MSKRRKSFGAKRQQTARNVFVGREEPLRRFRENLSFDPYDDRFLNIFNVFGQGGVGKSTLLDQYNGAAVAAGKHCVTVDTEDTSRYDVPATMAYIAEQLGQRGIDFAAFNERFKSFQTEKGKLEADPDKPAGILGQLVTTGLKTGAKLGAGLLPMGSTVHDLLPMDTIAGAAGDWADFVAKKLRNKDEITLVLEPLKVLTPLWIEGLYNAEESGHCPVLIFDTYETANPELDRWLFDLFNNAYGDFPSFLLVIAGRKELADQPWRALRGHIHALALNPFTEEEATRYLEERGVTDPDLVTSILELSGRLPIYLSLLSEGAAEEGVVNDPNDRIVERFLKHIKDPTRRQLALHASLPGELNQDLVGHLLPEELRPEAGAYFDWLRGRPFVSKRGGKWVYHPIVRETMIRFQRETAPVAFESINQALAHWYATRAARLEVEGNDWPQDLAWRDLNARMHFHALLVNYPVAIRDAVRDFVRCLQIGKNNKLPVLGLFVRKVESLLRVPDPWGEALIMEAEPAPDGGWALSTLKRLRDTPWLADPILRATVYYLLGEFSRESTERVTFYQQAFDNDRDNPIIANTAGTALALTGQYATAVPYLERAVKLSPTDLAAGENLAYCYREVGNYEAALVVYEDLLAKDKERYKAIYGAAIANEHLGHHERALTHFGKIIQSHPEQWESFAGLARVYINLKDFGAALTAVEAARRLAPEENYLNYLDGNVHYGSGNLPAATSSYRAYLAAEPGDANVVYLLAWAYYRAGNLEGCKEALERCWLLGDKAAPQVGLMLAAVHLAVEEETQAFELLGAIRKILPAETNFGEYCLAGFAALDMVKYGVGVEKFEELVTRSE